VLQGHECCWTVLYCPCNLGLDIDGLAFQVIEPVGLDGPTDRVGSYGLGLRGKTINKIKRIVLSVLFLHVLPLNMLKLEYVYF
jgi:hypothetical protein